MNEDEQIVWGQPISFQNFVQGFQVTPNQRKVELVPKVDPQKFYIREKVAPPSQNQGEIRDANKERVNRSLSNYASNNFLLSTSNIRPDQNGRYNPGLGQFAGDQTALALSMGFDPFNASNYYKVATQIPKFRNWGLTRLLANELNNEVRVAGELGKNVGSTTQFVFPQFKNVTRTVQDNGKIRLSLPSHTDTNPRQFVLEPQGNNKFYVHMRTWDGDHIPANLSNKDKQTLFQALYDELPEGGEILFPKSGPGYYGTRGTVAGLQRLSRDSRFSPGTKGTLQYLDKDGTIKTYEGTSFIKKSIQEPRTSLKFFEHRTDLAKTLTDSQWDSGYLPAAEAGDLITSKALRDTHFVTKSGNNFLVSRGKPVQLYHGVKSEYNPAFIEFNPNIEGTHSAIYLSNNEPMSRSYIGPFKYKDNNFLKKLYAKVEHPFIVDAEGRIWSDIPYGENVLSTRILEQRLKHQNILGNIGKGGTKADGIIVKNVQDWGGPYGRYKAAQEGKLTGDVIAIDNPSFIKSSEAITYDNNRKIIPLSQRDNFINSDIRYYQGGKIIEKFKNRNK